MSVYSLNQRFCFLHIPKNAGTSIRAALREMSDDTAAFETIDAKYRDVRDPALANHLPLYRLEDLLMRAESDIPLGQHYVRPLRTFMVVRNPWARMVSLYFHRLRKLRLKVDGQPRNAPEDILIAEAGFIPWLLETPNAGDKILTRMPQAEWGKESPGDSMLAVDRVLRQERLTNDWLDLLEDWGLPRVSLVRANEGGGQSKDYRRHYDTAAREHVVKYFAEDIRRFGYAF